MPYLTTPEDLGVLIEGEPAFRVDQLRQWLYRRPVMTTDEMTNLPQSVRTAIGDRLWPMTVEAERAGDDGSTVKWLFRSPDGTAWESVLMGYPRRTTLCISSQAGCAMRCTFCATGQFGFERHLDAGEIFAQVAWANARLATEPLPGSPPRVTNVVFMGMGEPLANYPNVREAIRRMVDVAGMSGRSVTVSTVGITPAIDRLAAEPWPVTLAISLHAADDHLRQQLVPIAARYPLDGLIEAAERFRRSHGRRVSLEWALMDGINDTPEQARSLASIARELQAHVNVIPLNPTPLAPQRPPSEERVAAFVADVRRHGAKCTLRDTRGAEIDAACGQLRAKAPA
ncbi:MAG: 23S rRNA (adenine(2503)-C(2))-methyltransferase RlmN [Acidimicrobiia bacterium]|nr:MAG: 23S rRNA (adenine(2503)-C(2))-methyltransferase RlmN [Acidimicrobiia bacterium]